MNQHRAGEKDKVVPFRNERYFCTNGEWYFETRNGGQYGPYSSKKEMEAELLLFLRDTALSRDFISG